MEKPINKIKADLREVYDELARQNIYIRNAASMSVQFDQDFIRTAVRDKQGNDKIYSALRVALTNE